MIPKEEPDRAVIKKAKDLQNVCWGEEYERMVSGVLFVKLLWAHYFGL